MFGLSQGGGNCVPNPLNGVAFKDGLSHAWSQVALLKQLTGTGGRWWACLGRGARWPGLSFTGAGSGDSAGVLCASGFVLTHSSRRPWVGLGVPCEAFTTSLCYLAGKSSREAAATTPLPSAGSAPGFQPWRVGSCIYSDFPPENSTFITGQRPSAT